MHGITITYRHFEYRDIGLLRFWWSYQLTHQKTRWTLKKGIGSDSNGTLKLIPSWSFNCSHSVSKLLLKQFTFIQFTGFTHCVKCDLYLSHAWFFSVDYTRKIKKCTRVNMTWSSSRKLITELPINQRHRSFRYASSPCLWYRFQYLSC